MLHKYRLKNCFPTRDHQNSNFYRKKKTTAAIENIDIKGAWKLREQESPIKFVEYENIGS